jgi:ParB-like chromosome segregation protein Spo0J
MFKKNKTEFKENSFVDIPLDLLVPADWNYKTDDEYRQEKLKNNIKRNGQVENIIVRLLSTGFYEIVNGNHRYQAL